LIARYVGAARLKSAVEYCNAGKAGLERATVEPKVPITLSAVTWFVRAIAVTVASLNFSGPAVAQSTAPPKLYLYPPPYRLPNGTLSPSILTIAPEQITTLMPEIKEMDGVVLKVAWSKVCPTRNACDFALIDQVLDYWRSRGKKVILNVSTMGYPVKVMIDSQERFLEHTPAWVLNDVHTYAAHSPTLGVIAGMDVSEGVSHVDTVFPSFMDDRFLSHVRRLVKQLAEKYDGNPTVSYVRISTGLMGEDNPVPPRIYRVFPHFTVTNWIDYCERITSTYLDAFHRSQLEFDISYIPSAYGKNAQPGVHERAEQFLRLLNDKHIFIAFNGLQPADQEYLQETSGPASGPTAGANPVYALRFLRESKQLGNHIGLEERSPISNPKMQDASAIAATVKSIGADRLVLFGLDAGVLNYRRNGSNPTNATTVQFLQGGRNSIEELGDQVASILAFLGYAQAAPSEPKRH